MFRTRRQHRYELLRKVGFLPFEARTISRVPLKVPYLDRLMKERFKDYKQAFKEEWSRAKWERSIKKQYREYNWFDNKGRADPWQMLRDFEHGYRAKHPEYESPWEKRRQKMKDFIAVVEKELVKLPERPPMSTAMKRRMREQQQEAKRQFEHIRETRKEEEKEKQ